MTHQQNTYPPSYITRLETPCTTSHSVWVVEEPHYERACKEARFLAGCGVYLTVFHDAALAAEFELRIEKHTTGG